MRSYSANSEHFYGAHVQINEIVRGLREVLTSESRNSPNALLLDVGAGRRTYLELYTSLFPRNFAIDIPWSMHQVQIDVFGSALSLPIQNGSIDVVLCTEVLEHLPNPTLALAEQYRVLKHGGLLVLTVPFMQAEHEQPHDYFRFTRYALDLLARNAGFASIDILPIGEFFATTHSFVVKPFLKLFGFLHRRLHLPFVMSPVNPIILLGVILPSVLLRTWYRHRFRFPLLSRTFDKLSYQPLGFLLTARKPAQ